MLPAYTFEDRAQEFLRDTKSLPSITPEEITAISAQYSSDAERLVALERLVRPRLGYEWQQAGGPVCRFTDVTAQKIELARGYYVRLIVVRERS